MFAKNPNVLLSVGKHNNICIDLNKRIFFQSVSHQLFEKNCAIRFLERKIANSWKKHSINVRYNPENDTIDSHRVDDSNLIFPNNHRKREQDRSKGFLRHNGNQPNKADIVSSIMSSLDRDNDRNNTHYNTDNHSNGYRRDASAMRRFSSSATNPLLYGNSISLDNTYCWEMKDGYLSVFMKSEATKNSPDTTNNFREEKHKKEQVSMSDSNLDRQEHNQGSEGLNSDMGGDAKLEVDQQEAIRLKWERQLRKVRAADRAGGKVTAEEHLHVLYKDEHVVAVNKPSGILCVPGIHARDSLLTLVFHSFGLSSSIGSTQNASTSCNTNSKHKNGNGEKDNIKKMERMIVHRLDMDTSGVVLFARSEEAMSKLHKAFRERKVSKIYEALVCGHVHANNGLLDLPLQRDHEHPPFMRCATPQSEHDAAIAVEHLQNSGYKKLMKRKPKPSQTEFQIVSKETYPRINHNTYKLTNNSFSPKQDDDDDNSNLSSLPVTRLKLIPHTGWTHQLRVHCAALGHAIVADSAYGIYGEAAANGGLLASSIFNKDVNYHLNLQKQINTIVQRTEQRMCLHAKSLEFQHPITLKLIKIEAPTPF